jgi:23S rRNA (uracil1939-C5)-methyltransferase
MLAGLVRDAVGPNRAVADLYCGVGLFAACLDAPARVVAVERGRTAVRDAKENLRDRAGVVRADVTKWKPQRVDAVVADPSRAGLGRGGVQAVVGCDPQRVVLVSCDAAAMARDLRLLYEGGYDVVSITPVDMFPNTPHVECVTVLERD